MATDRKRALEIKKELTSAVQSDRPADIVLLLRRFKTELREPSAELLRETKLGITVGKLRQNSSKEVADLAKELVKQWKSAVNGPNGKSAHASTSQSPAPDSIAPSPAAMSPPAPSPHASTSAAAAPPHHRRASGSSVALKPGESRNADKDGIDFRETGDPTRDPSMKQIYNALVYDSAAPAELVFERAKAIEAGVLEAYGDSSGAPDKAYRERMRTLCFNLKDKKNPDLRRAVIEGDLSIDKIATMSQQDMASSEMQAKNKAMAEQNLWSAQGAQAKAAETDMFKCGRCKQRKCSYYQMQTRSADEPMTTFVMCTVCSNRWKF